MSWSWYSCLEEALPTGMCDLQWHSWLGIAERIPWPVVGPVLVFYLLIVCAFLLRTEVRSWPTRRPAPTIL